MKIILSTEQVTITKENPELVEKIEKVISKYLLEFDTEYNRSIIKIEIEKLIRPFIRDKKIDIICL